MRGHYAVGVQSREQGEEYRKQCVAGALGRAPHGHSAVLKSREQGEENRKQCVATMQWASVERGGMPRG